MTKIIKLNKHNILTVCCTVLTLALVAFIWLHSLKPADVSTQESNNVLFTMESLFAGLNINAELSSFIIRKAAHFLEFTALGFMVTVTFFSFANKIKYYIFHILFILLAVPVIDESVQYLAPQRSPQVNDVLLDFIGCITGLLLALAAIAVVRAILKLRKNKKNLKGRD